MPLPFNCSLIIRHLLFCNSRPSLTSLIDAFISPSIPVLVTLGVRSEFCRFAFYAVVTLGKLVSLWPGFLC